MRFSVDTEKQTLVLHDEDKELPLYSKEAFHHISRAWVKVGWDTKYIYSFSWMGRPVIQLPEDMIRIQEVIYDLKPDVVIETGVAHGGSLIFYASLMQAMGKGKVVGVDIEIRSHNRKAIEEHELFHRIELIEGDSVAKDTVDEVRKHVKEGDTVLVLLDSNHLKPHVLKELDAYAGFVTRDSYIVSTDGVMEWLTDVPRGDPSWDQDNPKKAAEEWVEKNPNFALIDPEIPFNEGDITERITHWPGAYLKRIK